MNRSNAPVLGAALPPFPLTALVGQEALREALLLAGVDPSIGGVVVSGPRGNAIGAAWKLARKKQDQGHPVEVRLHRTDGEVVMQPPPGEGDQ